MPSVTPKAQKPKANLGKSWGKTVHNLCAKSLESPILSTWLPVTFRGTVGNVWFIRSLLNTQTTHLSPFIGCHFPDVTRWFSPLSTAPINTPTHEKKEFYFIKHSAKPRQHIRQFPTHKFLVPFNTSEV